MATADFAKMVPGFDFLQGLMKSAGGAGLPSMSQWIAPTLNPEEIEKRISELRTVQFWLEQNAKLLGATIQALEVQRMTLSTLKTMNVQMDDLRESMKIKLPEAPASAPEPPAAKPAAEAPRQPATTRKKAAPDAGAQAGAIDPMQWWGALTKQFTDLATHALKEGGPAQQLGAAMGEAMAGTMAGAPAKALAKTAAKAAKTARTAAGKVARPAKAPVKPR